MGIHDAYMVVATLLLISDGGTKAAVIQAELDTGEDKGELLEMMLKQIEMLGNHGLNGTTSLPQGHTELASALLQVAPVVTIKGNITDPARRFTITFTVQATRDTHLLVRGESDDNDDGEDEYDSSGGVLQPVVDVVEPYVLGLAELVFNSILSFVISNFLEAATMDGAIRLV